MVYLFAKYTFLLCAFPHHIKYAHKWKQILTQLNLRVRCPKKVHFPPLSVCVNTIAQKYAVRFGIIIPYLRTKWKKKEDSTQSSLKAIPIALQMTKTNTFCSLISFSRWLKWNNSSCRLYNLFFLCNSKITIIRRLITLLYGLILTLLHCSVC